MSTTEQQNAEAWIGHEVVDESGTKIGTLEEIYIDDSSGRPEWLAIKTGMFGNKLNFAPMRGVTARDDALQISFPKSKVKDAPKVDPDGHLEPDEEEALYEYYGQGHGGSQVGEDQGRAQAGRQDATTQDTTTKGHDTSGPNTDRAMTRSEEELSVDKSQRETGKARLRKHIVTENVAMTVPVAHEEVRLEREPITDENRDAAMAGGDLTDEEHEVVLHEEQVDVDRKVVPKERVRLDTDTVTEDEHISEDVRKEQIDLDEDPK